MHSLLSVLLLSLLLGSSYGGADVTLAPYPFSPTCTGGSIFGITIQTDQCTPWLDIYLLLTSINGDNAQIWYKFFYIYIFFKNIYYIFLFFFFLLFFYILLFSLLLL
jgi:hypothetical protein